MGQTKKYYFRFVFKNGEHQDLYTTDREDMVKVRHLTTGTLMGATAAFTPSMWADVEEGKDTESRVNVVDVIAVQQWEKWA